MPKEERFYLKKLKMLEDVNILHIPVEELVDVPKEVIRLIRVKLKINITRGTKSFHCWKVSSDISHLEVFTGKYDVREDEIGIYWTRRLPGTFPE